MRYLFSFFRFLLFCSMESSLIHLDYKGKGLLFNYRKLWMIRIIHAKRHFPSLPTAKGCYLAEHYPIQFADQKLSLKEAQQTFECGWFIQKDLEGNLKKKATKRLIKHIAITSYGLVIDTLRPLNVGYYISVLDYNQYPQS